MKTTCTIILITAMFFFVGIIEGKGKPSTGGGDKATPTCAAKGMRLPTKDELVNLYKSEASWKNKGCVNSWGYCAYWSSNVYSAAYAYYVIMNGGFVYDEDKDAENDVRCVR